MKRDSHRVFLRHRCYTLNRDRAAFPCQLSPSRRLETTWLSFWKCVIIKCGTLTGIAYRNIILTFEKLFVWCCFAKYFDLVLCVDVEWFVGIFSHHGGIVVKIIRLLIDLLAMQNTDLVGIPTVGLSIYWMLVHTAYVFRCMCVFVQQ